MNYRELKSCLVCGGRRLTTFFDLGEQPLANAYHDGTKDQPRYPLAVNHCADCSHNQLTVSVDPSLMFDDYAYASDTTQTLRDYFAAFSGDVVERHGPCDVLEIACNTGALLAEFKDRGCRCLGIDPAKNLRPQSEARGLDVIIDYWGSPCLDAHQQPPRQSTQTRRRAMGGAL